MNKTCKCGCGKPVKCGEYHRGHHPACKKRAFGGPQTNYQSVWERRENDPKFRKWWREKNKGMIPWNKGLIADDYPNGTGRSDLLKWDGKSTTTLRQLGEWRRLRKRIIRRDEGKCRVCGSTDEIEIHHIVSVLEAPELAFDVSNIITICRPCHLKTPNFAARVFKEMKAKRLGN